MCSSWIYWFSCNFDREQHAGTLQGEATSKQKHIHFAAVPNGSKTREKQIEGAEKRIKEVHRGEKGLRKRASGGLARRERDSRVRVMRGILH